MSNQNGHHLSHTVFSILNRTTAKFRIVSSLLVFVALFGCRQNQNFNTATICLAKSVPPYPIFKDASAKAVMVINPVKFSPDGRRAAYADSRDGKHFVLVDGKPGKVYSAIGAMVFDAHGKRLAYVAHENHQVMVVVDGQEGNRYPDDQEIFEIKFDAQGHKVAYIHGSWQNGMQATVAGVEGEILRR